MNHHLHLKIYFVSMKIAPIEKQEGIGGRGPVLFKEGHTLNQANLFSYKFFSSCNRVQRSDE